MNQLVFIISLIWKLSKGLDKKLLQSKMFLSLLKADSSRIEIIIPQKTRSLKKDTINYFDYVKSDRNKVKEATPFFQMVLPKLLGLKEPIKLFLN